MGSELITVQISPLNLTMPEILPLGKHAHMFFASTVTAFRILCSLDRADCLILEAYSVVNVPDLFVCISPDDLLPALLTPCVRICGSTRRGTRVFTIALSHRFDRTR
jgi:hypothetical protein